MNEFTILSALPVTRAIYPPESLVHVGAIGGVAEMRSWREWPVTSGLAIDILPEGHWQPSTNVRYKQGVAAASARAAEITRSRLTMADGLLGVEAVRAAWPGVRDLRIESVTTQTLDQIIPTSNAPDWLIVDSLPAGEVLKGATRLLAAIQVLWVRVSLEAIPHWPAEAGVAFVEEIAQKSGLRCLAMSPGVDPRFGQVLYVRAPRKGAQTTLSSADAENNALQHAGNNGPEESDALKAKIARMELELGAFEEKMVGVIAERDLARTTAVAIATEKTVLLGRLAEAEAQLTGTRAALEESENQLGQLRGALVIQQTQRGHMDEVREEMTRAEAQLDLIKEIVGLRPRP